VPPVLYFIRHGETDWNVEGRLQGRRDIPLNPLGRVQAEEAGRKLRALVPQPEELDYAASPLARTRETMELMRAAMGLAPMAYRLDERLMELSFGRWEGLTWREIRAQDAGRAAQRDRRKWDYAPPDGESYQMLTDRVAPAVDALTRPAALVSHGGVARALLVRLCGLPKDETTRMDIHQGRVLVIEAGSFAWR